MLPGCSGGRAEAGEDGSKRAVRDGGHFNAFRQRSLAKRFMAISGQAICSELCQPAGMPPPRTKRGWPIPLLRSR